MRQLAVLMVVVCLLLAGCGGGKKKQPVNIPPSSAIQSLNFSPSTINTGTVVEISATFSNPQAFADVEKVWEVSAGLLSEETPDFDMVLRETAGIKGVSATVSTAASRVYWFTPATPGSYRVALRAGNSFIEQRVPVTTSPVYLEVASGENNTTIIRIMGREVSNLYQGAFRILFNPARYEAVAARPGSLLGGEDEVLFLGLTNQNGFVPIGITRKGAVPGVNGSGVIAEAVFAPIPTTASRAPRQLYLAGFELALYLLRDNSGEPIWGE